MAGQPGAKLTVLVADPDPAQQQILNQCLSPRFNVIFAGSFAEAQRQVATNMPSILLIDLDQPDGGDVRAYLRHLRDTPATKSMVLGIVTARASIHDKVSGFTSGADDYVVKPINPRTFVYRVVLLTRTRNLGM